MWHSMESFNLLALSRLECPKQCSGPSPIPDIHKRSLTLENTLYLFADDPTLCCDIPHPSDTQAAASSLSSDLEKKITRWSNTWNMSFNLYYRSLCLSVCLSVCLSLSLSLSLSPKDCLATLPHPTQSSVTQTPRSHYQP